MENIDFFSSNKAIETKSFIPCNQSWSRAFRNVVAFVSIASNDEKSAAQGAKKGRFCMGILVTLSLCPLWRPYRLFLPILLNLSSYGYSETTLSTKIFFSTYRCLFFTQTQSDQNPHTKSAIFSTLSSTFLTIGGDRNNNSYFLDARDHAWSNGMGVVHSIFLEKKSTFFMVPFSSVAL